MNKIYELHVRDFTSHWTSGIREKNRGKFLGLVERGTIYNGLSTGFDHLCELGITHIQLMPIQSVMNPTGHDWGYNPWDFNKINSNYGSHDEFKCIVQQFHNNGIKVILDVVYNHVPCGHFFDKSWYLDCDLSGCGHALNTYKKEVNEYIKSSLSYWVNEFDIDGFRFDLMGIYPYFRVIEWSEYLNKIKKVTLYGEPWAGFNGCPGYQMGDKSITNNMFKLSGVGVGCFNDHYRETVINHFIRNTNADLNNSLGLIHSHQSINYVTCHDNYTLYDLIKLNGHWDTWKIAKKIIKFQMNSKGTPFIFSGDEFLRSKRIGRELHRNTWDKGDKFNQIDWSFKERNLEVFEYYKKSIKSSKSMV